MYSAQFSRISIKLLDLVPAKSKYTLNAKKLGIGNRSKFSLDSMTRKLGKILDKYVPEFPKEVKLELPKLKKVSSSEQPKIKLPKLKKV